MRQWWRRAQRHVGRAPLWAECQHVHTSSDNILDICFIFLIKSLEFHFAVKHLTNLRIVSVFGRQRPLHVDVNVVCFCLQRSILMVTSQHRLTACLCVLLSSLRLTQQTVRRKKRKKTWKGRKKVWCREQSDGYSLSEEKRKPERKITEKRSFRRNRHISSSSHSTDTINDCLSGRLISFHD